MKLATLLAVALCHGPLFGHDFWIEPTTFSPDSGQVVGLRLRVGQELMGDPVPRDPSLVNQFVVESAEGRRPIFGRTGSDPAGMLRVVRPGLQVVGYYSNPSPVEMEAEKFNEYLKQEGLESVAALRARRKETGAKAHEQFSRCAKSLVSSGPATPADKDRALGFPLELIAERNPYALRTGEDLTVRLLYENRPLAGALVVAMDRQNPNEKQMVRTGSDGRARIRLMRGGMWLVKAVHMIPAPAASGTDWSSFWASLTFEVPATAIARVSQ